MRKLCEEVFVRKKSVDVRIHFERGNFSLLNGREEISENIENFEASFATGVVRKTIKRVIPANIIVSPIPKEIERLILKYFCANLVQGSSKRTTVKVAKRITAVLSETENTTKQIAR